MMIASSPWPCAIIYLLLATRGDLVRAVSFRGAASPGDAVVGETKDDWLWLQHGQHHQRVLQEDPCAGKKNNQCPKDGPNPECNWVGGNCVPAAAPPTPPPVTPEPSSSPTNGPTNSPVPPGMGYCSDDATPCWSMSDCTCATAAAASSSVLFERRRLQDCSSASNGGACRKISGCDWVDNVCSSNAPGPTPSPVASTPQPTSSPSKAPTGQPIGSPTPCSCLGLGPTGSPTVKPSSSPSKAPTNQPTSPPTTKPSLSPTNSPTVSPTDQPTKTTPNPTPAPTNSPSVGPTYCGCPLCTAAIWNTIACEGTECYTCGSRITFKQTFEGGSLSESEACAFVSNEFPDGPCGPVCNPNTCIINPTTSSPTQNPTKEPTGSPSLAPTKRPTASPSKKPSESPTKSPSNVTPSPTRTPTSPPTEQFFCGCPACTAAVWNYNACNGSECYTCGSRISWLQSPEGGSNSEEAACAQVSNEFANNECGPYCNPLLCNPEYLDEPDAANLIWNDEFDIDGAPNSTKWDYDLGDGCDRGICGWGNGELQDYTNDPNNVLISNGILRISAKSNSPQPGYTSTRMVTRGKQAFRYGRIRFRASVANCQALGTWPALWMLPEEWVYGNWPNSGEIDVMETVGYEAEKFFGTVHTGAYNHAIGTQKGGEISKSKSDWHIFEIDWQADNIRFAIDKQVYYQFTPDNVADPAQWPFGEDFHLLMNIAVGGSWGGATGVDSSAFDGDGQFMLVDWVRVYSS